MEHNSINAETVKEPKPTSQSATKGTNLFRALSYRNYRLYFSGQTISLIGSWMTRIAMSWLVYRLSGSTLLLGLVGFAGQIPSFLLAPFSGVLVDRWNRHHLLVITQILAMLQSLLLAWLTLSGRITIWQIILLSIFQGIINAFDMPARQAFVVEMVDKKEDLSNAIALNSSMVNAGRLLGPSIGGILIASVGEGWCFFIDGISYIAVIASLLAMTLKPQLSQKDRQQSMLGQLCEGLVYVSRFAPIRTILLLLAIVSLMGMPYTVLMPAFASDVLHGGPNTLGMLMAASGVGALIGAVALASRKTVLGLGRIIPLTAGVFGIALIGFAEVRNIWLSGGFMLISGLGFMVQMAASNTLLQTLVDDDKRGRVMSFFTMAFMGTAPFGSLLAGSIASRIGTPNTLVISGLGCLAGAIWFAIVLPGLREEVRPIYRRLGIIPELATGINTTAELTSPPRD